MPRSRRIIIPGVAHHIVQRGNNRKWIFEEGEDFSTYCYLISKYVKKYKVQVVAYCLMNNHVHFVLIPEDRWGVSRLFNTVHMRYAQYKNFKWKTSGHVWQGRFYSCPCDGDHLYYAIRYVEQNPVRARLVEKAWDYKWSSAPWHVGQKVDKYIKIEKTSIVDKRYWKRYLINNEPEVDEKIRERTQKGKAFAGSEFIETWEEKLKCSLKDLKAGPKPKKKD